MRPPGPLPATAARSTPSSRARRRVDGVAGGGPAGRGAAGAGGGGEAGAERAAGAGAGVSDTGRAALGAGATSAASPNVTSTAPTFTVWPGVTWIFSTRPPMGDGISTLALSVSTSRSGVSSAITSPSWTSTSTISASVRPSPRSGSAKSRGMPLVREGLAGRGEHARGVGHGGLLPREAGERHVVGGDTADGGLEREERALHDGGRDLRAGAEAPGRLVHHERAPRLPDG